MVHPLEAVKQSGIDAEVIDLRWLDRASIDWETLDISIKKTKSAAIARTGEVVAGLERSRRGMGGR